MADVGLETDEAVPCGLIINELVSNALKHAFPDGREGVIGLKVWSRADGHLELQVSDTGVGFPPGLVLADSPSLGLKLVNTLVAQMGGTVRVTQGAGTVFTTDIRKPAHAG